MERLIEIALTNATSAVVLAVVALVAERFLRRPEVIRGLWLLVLARLLIPPLFVLGLPVLPAPVPLAKSWAASAAPAFTAAAVEPARTTVTSAHVAAAVWLAGALAVGALAAVRTMRLGGLLAAAAPAPPAFQERLASLAARMGIVRVPRAVVVDAAVSPMLWAAFGARKLVLPADLVGRLSDDEKDALSVHELAHLLRRDHWVRYLELAAVALYWWHPVAWWARRRSRRAEESCCDFLVARTLPGHRRAYADCLLKTLRFLAARRATTCPVASGLGEAKDLEGRLTMILKHNLPQRLPSALRTALAVAALVVLTVFPTLAQRAAGETSTAAPVTLRVEDAAVGQVLQRIAGASGLNFIIQPGVDLQRKVTAQFEKVPWDQALPEVLRQVGFGFSHEGNVLWVYGDEGLMGSAGQFVGQPINMSLENADLRETMANFATISQLTIVLDEGIQGGVTIELENVPWDQAFDAILRMNGLASTVEGDVVRVHVPRKDS